MREPPTIACMRPADMTGPPFPGSTREECAECGTEIWSDPEMREAIRQRHGEPTLICWPCSHVDEMSPIEFAIAFQDSREVLMGLIARKN